MEDADNEADDLPFLRPNQKLLLPLIPLKALIPLILDATEASSETLTTNPVLGLVSFVCRDDDPNCCLPCRLNCAAICCRLELV